MNIHIKESKKGTLHTALGVSQGEKIPVSKLTIHEGDSEALMKKKRFALNARKWHHAAEGMKNVPYESLFRSASERYNVPYDILTSLAKEESNFNPRANSGEARGLMQINPRYTPRSEHSKMYDPAWNIERGAKILSDYHKRAGNWYDAIGYYNAGPDGWKKNKQGVIRESPRYFSNLNRIVTEYYQNERKKDVRMQSPAAADNTRFTPVVRNPNIGSVNKDVLAELYSTRGQIDENTFRRLFNMD